MGEGDACCYEVGGKLDGWEEEKREGLLGCISLSITRILQAFVITIFVYSSLRDCSQALQNESKHHASSHSWLLEAVEDFTQGFA